MEEAVCNLTLDGELMARFCSEHAHRAMDGTTEEARMGDLSPCPTCGDEWGDHTLDEKDECREDCESDEAFDRDMAAAVRTLREGGGTRATSEGGSDG